MKNPGVFAEWQKLSKRRQGVQQKYIELNKLKATRELNTDEGAKWQELEAELTDLNSRVATLEDILQGDKADDAAQNRDGDGDTGNGGDGGGDADLAKRGITRNDDGTYNLPNGKRAVLLGAGGNDRRTLPKPGGGSGGDIDNDDPDAQRRAALRQRRSAMPYRKGLQAYLTGGGRQSRAIQQDLDVSGGFLVAPMQVSSEILKKVDNKIFLRGLATKIKVVNGESLGNPTLDTDPADADWTPEIGTVAEETAMTFGRRELKPNSQSKLIKVSNKALRNAVVTGFISADGDTADKSLSGLEGLIANRFGYKFAVSEEKAMLTGNGVGQPLGLFTASARGINTDRDIVTGSATGLTYAGLLNIKYALKQGYNGQWLISVDFLKLAQGLVDSQNRPLFIDPMNLDQPATLMGRPINLSYYVPNTFTTGLYVGMYADFSFYMIADGEDFYIIRLDELFALTNQTGFMGYREMDAMPTLSEAFVRIKTS